MQVNNLMAPPTVPDTSAAQQKISDIGSQLARIQSPITSSISAPQTVVRGVGSVGSGRLLTDNTNGMLVLAKGGEIDESMAIKQPLDRVIGTYNKGSALVDSVTSSSGRPIAVSSDKPVPLDPAAMGGVTNKDINSVEA